MLLVTLVSYPLALNKTCDDQLHFFSISHFIVYYQLNVEACHSRDQSFCPFREGLSSEAVAGRGAHDHPCLLGLSIH